MEVAIAILVISIGAIGLAGMQLSAKRAGFEAVQRTNASSLAMDILERMRVNPGEIASYDTSDLDDKGVGGALVETPASKCDSASCTGAQLADLDLWDWEQALDGAAEVRAGASVGGLLNPKGCIVVNGREVSVTIAWQGYETLSDPDSVNDCGEGKYGTDDEQRHLLVINTFIADL